MTDVDRNIGENNARVEFVEDDDSDDDEWVEVDWPERESDGGIICDCPNENATSENCNCQYHEFLRSTNEERSRVVLESQNDNTNDDEVDRPASNNSGESDDISVITDNEIDPSTLSTNFGELQRFKGKICGPLKMFEGHRVESIQVGTPFHIILQCALAVCTVGLLALAASYIYSVANTCSVSDRIDFEAMKLEADNLIAKCKDLNEIKRVLEQIKANMTWSKKFPKDEKKILSQKVENSFKILDVNSFNSTSNVLQQLKTSLNVLSTSVNEINGTNEVLEMKMNQTQAIISDLNMFQNIMTDLVDKLGNLNKPIEIKFLQSANNEINRVSQSALSHLLETVHELTVKMYKKFDKIKYKINKRLCCTRNASSDGYDFLMDLDKNNSFLNSCDVLLNIKCNTYNKTKKKHRTKGYDTNVKRKKWIDIEKATITVSNNKENPWEDTFSKKTEIDHDLMHAEHKRAAESNIEKKVDNKCDTISELPLSRNECLVQQSRWIYPEMESFYNGFGTSELNINELGSDSLYELVSNNNTETKKNVTKIHRDTENLNILQKQNVDVSIDDDTEPNIFENEIFRMDTFEKENRKKNKEYLDFIDKIQKVLSDFPNVNDASKKKRRSKEQDSATFKENEYKEKKSRKWKNWDKIRKSLVDKYRDEENGNTEVSDADWQFERSRARERIRLLKNALQNFEDDYTRRDQSRKEARESMEFLNKEKEFLDDWLERKDMNTRRYNNGKYSIKFTNRSHRKNILQTKRR